MTPQEFLKEEFDNVRLALQETLRYDYGPDLTPGYFEECAARLSRIEPEIPRTKLSEISVRSYDLSQIAGWISLIERSRLGEFSWPFARQIRDIAKTLLAEKTLIGTDIEPIVHVIAEGDTYRIVYEETISDSVGPVLQSCVFPRPLKHHVLLHTIFGHELGHTAQATTAAGSILQSEVWDSLSEREQLMDANALTQWIHRSDAPPAVKADLASWLATAGKKFEFIEYYRRSWLEEFVCDLFGLLLFGPAFCCSS